jgi:hypothetical protein
MVHENLEKRKAEMVQKYLDDEISTAEFIAFNQTYMVKGRNHIPLMKRSDDRELVEKAAA